jgi:succinoglycan biosynthesis transport protein ExoP
MHGRIPIATPPEAQAETSGLDLRSMLRFVWRRWKLIAAGLLLSALVGWLVLARATPLYTATAQVLLDTRKEKAIGEDNILTDLALNNSSVESQIAIMKSDALLRRVVEREHFVSAPPSARPAEPEGRLARLKARFWWAPPQVAPDPPYEALVQNAIESIKGAVSISRSGNAFVLNVSATSSDPQMAARIANAVAEAYVVDSLDARFDAAKRASAWLSDRLDEMRKQLRSSEEAVAQFKADNGLVTGGSASVTLNDQQVSDLNAKLVAARAEVGDQKAGLDLLQSAIKKGKIDEVPDVIKSGAVGALKGQLADVSRREADLLSRYSERHPFVVNVRAERREIERNLALELQRSSALLRNQYELSKGRVDQLEDLLKQATGLSGVDKQAGIKLRELERQASVNKTLFEDFLVRAKVTQEQASFGARESRVITPAKPPGEPSSPNRNQIMTIALVLGLGAGLGAAIGLEALKGGYHTAREIEEAFGIPVLATISRVGKDERIIDGVAVSLPDQVIKKPLSRFSEAIRGLRSGIQMTDVDDPPKVIEVTSTLPNEGKTTIAVSLALSAAFAGQKVALIDADLRHPAASRHFGLEKEPGLVDLLVGNGGADLVRYQEGSNIWVLPCGSKSQNPSDLLNSQRMKALVASLKAAFDYVIIDTPPVGAVIDAAVLTQIADRTLLVVKWASTDRDGVERSVAKLSLNRRVAGVALNFINDRQALKYGSQVYPYAGKQFSRYYVS